MSTINELYSALRRFGTVTISSDSPFVKTVFASLLADYVISQDLSTYYFDCDLQYSSLLAQQKVRTGYSNHLLLAAPGERDIVGSISRFLSLPQKKGGLVVIDTINTLQNLLRAKESSDSMRANQKSATVVTLFQQFAEMGDKLLLIANLTRSRPSAGLGAVSWEREISGGRMSRIKSDVVLSIKKSGNDQQNSILCIVDQISRNNPSTEVSEGANFVVDVAPILH